VVRIWSLTSWSLRRIAAQALSAAPRRVAVRGTASLWALFFLFILSLGKPRGLPLLLTGVRR